MSYWVRVRKSDTEDHYLNLDAATKIIVSSSDQRIRVVFPTATQYLFDVERQRDANAYDQIINYLHQREP